MADYKVINGEVTYHEYWSAIKDYYGGIDGINAKINAGEFTLDEFRRMVDNGEIPGVSVDTLGDGTKTYYREFKLGVGDYNSGGIGQEINSNYSPGKWYTPKTATAKTPAKISVDEQSQVITIDKEPPAIKGYTVLENVASGVLAVSSGIALGKVIDQTLYNLNPDFWDSHNMSTLNPDTWHDISIDGGTIPDKIFNMLFSNNASGSTQAYAPATALAYVAAYMAKQDTLENKKIIDDSETLPGFGHIPSFGYSPKGSVYWYGTGQGLTPELGAWCKNGKIALFKLSPTSQSYMAVVATKESSLDIEYPEGHGRFSGNQAYYYNGKTVRYTGYVTSSVGFINAVGNFNYVTEEEYNYLTAFSIDHFLHMGEVAWRMIYGSPRSGGIKGITDADGAKQPVIFGDVSDIEKVKEQLEEQYPELFENKQTLTTVLDDGTVVLEDYLPVPFPKDLIQPKSSTSTQTEPEIDPETSDKDLIKTLIDTITGLKDTNPPNTGTGDSPEIILPTGSASSLWAIYNPTQSEVDDFGSWLWSSNFVEQIKKLFADPMQAIIGLHKVFATPSTGSPQNIKVGYLDSGVSSAVVTSQYTTIDCGTVNILEYYGNVFDYAPYTDIKLFLPFIGFVELDTADVMRSTVGVKYHVDVLSGACLAEVSVHRDGGGGILYSFAGNCSVSYPVSSGNYASIMASLIGAVVSVGATAVGAAPVSVAGTALNRLVHTRTSVEHSGGFSGHSGAMGVKTPYIVITRPQTAVADSYETLQGRPANNFVRIGSLSGFNRISKVHVEGISATSDELDMIESILKSGIIV